MATARPDDELEVHSFSADGATPPGIDGYTPIRTLPAPTARSEGTLRWLTSRAATYVQRAQLRHRAVLEGGYDLVHLFSLNLFTDWASLGRLPSRVPVVSTVHDVVPHQRRLPEPVETALLRRTYDAAGTLVVAHDWMRRRLVDDFGVETHRIEVIPFPIEDLAVGDDGERDMVLFFGTLRRNKGIEVWLDAIDRLRGRPDLRFTIAGTGPAELRDRVARAASRDRRLTAELRFIDDARKAELYRRARLVVLPYTSFASMSGVLRDAYAFRVPVVVSDVGALGEAVRDDGTGWVVHPGDAESLAIAVLAAWDDDERRANATAAAARLAAGRSYEAIGGQIRGLYDRLVGG